MSIPSEPTRTWSETQRTPPSAFVRAAIPLTLGAVIAATPLWGGYVTLIVVLALWRSAARLG